jgi:nitrogen fixation-related uncharacterized protein
MLITDFYKIHVSISLVIIAIILALSIIASLLWPDKQGQTIVKDE